MMGLSFVYALSGSLYFQNIYLALTGQHSTMLVLALAFVISGVGFKLSLVPFHLWTADVYQGAPTSVTSYLSVISKGAAAFAFPCNTLPGLRRGLRQHLGVDALRPDYTYHHRR